MKGKKKSGVEANKKKIIALAIALILLVGGTYAWLRISLTGTKTVRIEAGTLSLELVDEANAISMTNALPMSDEEGLETVPYTFVLNNNGTIPSEYTVYLDKQGVDETKAFAMDPQHIRYTLKKTTMKINGTKDAVDAEDGDDEVVGVEEFGTTEVLKFSDIVTEDGSSVVLDSSSASGTIVSGNYIIYELQLWIDKDATNSDMSKKIADPNDAEKTITVNAEYSGKLRIDATQVGIEDDQAYGEGQ